VTPAHGVSANTKAGYFYVAVILHNFENTSVTLSLDHDEFY